MSDIPTEAYQKELHRDAYEEILLRVPVETLFQLRSVCKTWRRIIDGPRFAKLHMSHGIGEDRWILHKSKHGKLFLLPLRHLVYHMPVQRMPAFIYDDMVYKCHCDKALMKVCPKCFLDFVDATNVKVPVCPGVPRIRDLPVPNCNGLILISSSKPNLVWVIWNPFTSESLKLPSWDEIPNDYRKGYCERPYSWIGYDEASGDYKVVRIVESCTFIYSVNSRVWRRTCDFPTDYIEPHSWDGVFVNGALHWVSNGWGCWIVALDLATESYRKIPLPLEVSNMRAHCHLKLVALSGFLFLSRWNTKDLFDLWMIKDYNGSDDRMWTKMMSLELGGEFVGLHTPIAYLKDGNLILIQRRSEMFWWYNVEKKILKEVSMDVDKHGNGGDCDYDSFSSQVIPASLVRLQSSDGANEQGKPSKRKRKRGEPQTLGLKVLFGNPVHW